MSWIPGAEWIARRKRGEGLCDRIHQPIATAYEPFAVLDAKDYSACDQPAAEVVQVGNRFAPRCAIHADQFRVEDPRTRARQAVVMAALLCKQEPLLG